MKRPLYAFLFFSFCSFSAYSQLTSCTQTLRLARSTYEQGRLHEIQGLFEKCLESGFSKEEKVEAYKLLCLSYIYLEEPAKANEAMLNLLRTNHYFEIKEESDPAEFVALYRTFRTDPVYRIGLKLGANATMPNVVSYLPSNELPSEYDYGFAFQSGFALDIPLARLSRKLTLHPELVFQLKSFKYTNEGAYDDVDADGNPFSRSFETNGVERQTWISLPVSLQYELFEKRYKPYAGLGVSADYLLAATNTFRRTKEDATSLDEQSLDLKDSRNAVNISAILSAGVKFRVTGGFATLEMRYAYGLSQINSKEKIYNNIDKVNPTGGYVDGIIRLNSFSVTIGYMYNHFNPKKIKK
jgi:opacity protein-like surface antigen